MQTVSSAEPREWIIQRCIDAEAKHYEDWSTVEVELMTRSEALVALKVCQELWPGDEFRGHNVANQRPGSDILRSVR